MHNYESQKELINLNAITDFASHMYEIGTCDQNEIHMKLPKLLNNFIGLKSIRLITDKSPPNVYTCIYPVYEQKEK